MFLATQPDELTAFLEKDRGSRALGNGFFARFLYAESTPLVVQLSTESKPGVTDFKEKVRAILEAPMTDVRQDIQMSSNAAEYWTSYFNTLRQLEPQIQWMTEISGFVRKLPEQAARIAALFQCLEFYGDAWEAERVPSISERAMRNAVQLCDWFMHSYRARFSQDGEARKKKVQSIADIVLKKLADKYEEKTRLNRASPPPRIDKSYRIGNVDPGALFTWNQRDWIIAYTQRNIRNNLYECNYALLGEALDLLGEIGKVYIAPGPRDGKVVLYTGSNLSRWQGPRNWKDLLPAMARYSNF